MFCSPLTCLSVLNTTEMFGIYKFLWSRGSVDTFLVTMSRAGPDGYTKPFLYWKKDEAKDFFALLKSFTLFTNWSFLLSWGLVGPGGAILSVGNLVNLSVDFFWFRSWTNSKDFVSLLLTLLFLRV